MKTNRREFLIGATVASVVVPSIAMAMPDEGVAVRNWASMIEDYLTARGVGVDPLYISKEGSRIGDFGSSYQYQRHIDIMPYPPEYHASLISKHDVERLARSVLRQAKWLRRSRVQFANLWMPPVGRGVIDAAQYQSERVHVRELGCYEIMTDSIMRRVDVLFRVV